MQPSEIQRALAAALSTASALGLAVDDTIVLHNSNKLTVRLLPGDVVARVAPITHQAARFEIELAQRLAESGSPVAVPDPRAEPRVHERAAHGSTVAAARRRHAPARRSGSRCATRLRAT
jgi:hypothetical protein